MASWSLSGNIQPTYLHKKNSNVQSIPNVTVTNGLFDTVISSHGNSPSYAGTGVFTVNTSGSYLIVATICWASNATNVRQAWFRYNGSDSPRYAQTTIQAVTEAAVSTTYTLNWIKNFNVGDTFALRLYQDCGSPLNVGGDSTVNANIIDIHYLNPI